MTKYSAYYGGYLHSEEWFKRRKRAFRIWSALGWRFVMVWYTDGHHWLGYKHLGFEHWWEIMPVSRRINSMEKFFRTRLHLNSIVGTWLAIALLRPWLWGVPMWMVLGGISLHLPVRAAALWALHGVFGFIGWVLSPIARHIPASQTTPVKQGFIETWHQMWRLLHGHGLRSLRDRHGLGGDLAH